MAISKDYSVGDTVYVQQKVFVSLPLEKVVAKVDVTEADDTSTTFFTDGTSITDGDTVYTTEALCATAIVNDVISQTVSLVALDPTTSVASTAGQTTTTLGRVDT